MNVKIESSQREIIQAFNSNPKNGINKIKELLKDIEPVNVENEIAEFFIKNRKNLDLEAVGDYLSGPEEESHKVLTYFVGKIVLKDQSFTEGLRHFLNAFKLPGEAQKIDRLMEGFGKAYHAQNPNLVANPDAAYLLAFQAIMLNTNLHNPNVRESDKYTFDKLVSIIRGCNGGKDFNRNLIEDIFNNIRNKPFVFNFVKTSPGYELNSSSLFNDPTFKKLDLLLQSETTPQDAFGVGPNVKATVDKPKSWLNNLIGYEGKITLTDDQTKAVVSVQVYKPGFFSKWLFGEHPKVIIQPVYHQERDSKETIQLAAKIAASFKSNIHSIKATYDYEKEDLEIAYKENRELINKEASPLFFNIWKKDSGDDGTNEPENKKGMGF